MFLVNQSVDRWQISSILKTDLQTRDLVAGIYMYPWQWLPIRRPSAYLFNKDLHNKCRGWQWMTSAWRNWKLWNSGACKTCIVDCFHDNPAEVSNQCPFIEYFYGGLFVFVDILFYQHYFFLLSQIILVIGQCRTYSIRSKVWNIYGERPQSFESQLYL